MTPSQSAPCLGDLFSPSAQDLTHHPGREINGEAADIESQDHLTAHGIHVAHGIGGGDGSVVVGIVNDGRKEVNGQDNGQFIADAIDGSVVAHLQADEQVRVFFGGEHPAQGAQHLRQGLRAHLGRSARAAG